MTIGKKNFIMMLAVKRRAGARRPKEKGSLAENPLAADPETPRSLSAKAERMSSRYRGRKDAVTGMKMGGTAKLIRPMQGLRGAFSYHGGAMAKEEAEQ